MKCSKYRKKVNGIAQLKEKNGKPSKVKMPKIVCPICNDDKEDKVFMRGPEGEHFNCTRRKYEQTSRKY